MALTTFGIIFLIGAALSLRFVMLILFPAIIFAIIGIVAHGDSVGAMMLTIGFVAAALQIGYLVGLIFRAALASLGVIQSRAGVVEEFGLREIIAAKHPVPSTSPAGRRALSGSASCAIALPTPRINGKGRHKIRILPCSLVGRLRSCL